MPVLKSIVPISVVSPGNSVEAQIIAPLPSAELETLGWGSENKLSR